MLPSPPLHSDLVLTSPHRAEGAGAVWQWPEQSPRACDLPDSAPGRAGFAERGDRPPSRSLSSWPGLFEGYWSVEAPPPRHSLTRLNVQRLLQAGRCDQSPGGPQYEEPVAEVTSFPQKGSHHG